MAISNTDYEFIELNRTFHELKTEGVESDDVDLTWLPGLSRSQRWPDLIKEYRLIILSEAGSGKTTEILNVARSLRKKDKHAFFLRLEHISADFEVAFEVGTYGAFEEWLKSEKEGWIFLDSVDEARLRNPGDFELAIRNLSNRIQVALNQAHIVITGRTTAWRPKTDLNLCVTQLSYNDTTSEREPQPEEKETDDDRNEVKTEDKKHSKSAFVIVVLDELTSEQIAIFAEARGVD